jgi:hypothetical protein
MVLGVLERPEAGCLDLARVIHRSHERRAQRRIFGREAKGMIETLRAAGIIEVEEGSRKVRLHVDLQDDFSLHHALSLWLVDTLALLDPESPTYGVDVLTLVESILEDPEFVLRQQLDALKRAKLGELKAAGVEYDQRIEELEKMEHPKPLRELVYDAFNAFRRLHPWVAGDDVKPKSIAREMFERFMDFNEYVREYELGRAEGTLLRYLSDVYKALVQTVPAPAKTPAVEEVEVFLRAIVRSVDSSLLDEWERLRGGEAAADAAGASPLAELGEPDVTRDPRAFTVLVRAAMFQMLRALAARDWAAAAALVTPAEVDADPWPPERFARALAPFFEEHAVLRLDPSARAPHKTAVTPGPAGTWDVVQVISDGEEDDDWALSCFVDLARSSAQGKPVVVMRAVSR